MRRYMRAAPTFNKEFCKSERHYVSKDGKCSTCRWLKRGLRDKGLQEYFRSLDCKKCNGEGCKKCLGTGYADAAKYRPKEIDPMKGMGVNNIVKRGIWQ